MLGPMFFGDVPGFDEILRAAGEFESQFNALSMGKSPWQSA